VISDQVITEQLSSKPLEEVCTIDYQKYYNQYGVAYDVTDYAKPHDCLTLAGDNCDKISMDIGLVS
jgi:hypothetical protein